MFLRILKNFIPLVLVYAYCTQTIASNDHILNDLIRYFEFVDYDSDYFQAQHHRTKRAADTVLELDFKSHGRFFKLRLQRDSDVISPKLIVEKDNRIIQPDTQIAYTGQLEDEPNSKVFGIVTRDGLFQGFVHTSDRREFVVEPSSRYFRNQTSFHSVMYDTQNIDTDKIVLNTSCSSNVLFQTLQKELFSKETNDSFSAYKDGVYSRRKRAVSSNKTQCTLFLHADHTYYQYYRSEAEVVSQFTAHVQAVNKIYEATDFNLDGYADGITFQIARIKIWTNTSLSGYCCANEALDVTSYLNAFSTNVDYGDYCLAALFGNRDFSGTLGLAWTAAVDTAGGVCQKQGVYAGVTKSLNSAIVTVKNFGNQMPLAISALTMAHELGHNMGAQHDADGTPCAPGGSQGNFIMYPYATDGTKHNNQLFSSCSISAMNTVMTVRGEDQANGCFQVATTAVCGNGVVDPGEECDCGYVDVCTDQCCNAPNGTHSVNACKLKPSKSCSPSQGDCCTSTCNFKSTSQECRAEQACTNTTYCNGSSAACPVSGTFKANMTVCPENDLTATQVCISGKCSGSICLTVGMEECYCQPTNANDWSDPKLCQLCCRVPGNASTCISSYAIANLTDLSAQAGSSCMDFKGFCDVFQKCRKIIPESELFDLFSLQAIQGYGHWLAVHWYYPLAVALGLIIILALMIGCCQPTKTSDKSYQKKLQKHQNTRRAQVSPHTGHSELDTF